MFRKLWQSGMIALARSKRVKNFAQHSRATSFLSGKYVSGDTSDAGIKRAQELLAENGIRSSLFYMGEYVDDWDLVTQNIDNKLDVAAKLGQAGLDVHVSVDPTQIGHHLDPDVVAGHAERIAKAVQAAVGNKDGVNCLMFDMEDASLNDPTIAVHNHMQDMGLPVALTLQAYLRRTRQDLQAQIARGSRVRLVKGAFAAPSDIAFTKRAEVKANSRALIGDMLSEKARENGFYPIIATHDTALQDFTIETARANGWQAGEYEFEMLLGV
ncbi:MAG TPA: proline dehydrogenase, partial [Rhodobacteraceae bacterium]|nr:proline dehydrogenase [Paracoccaceae bacterium]